jgi:DNA-binding transcriptional MerR regulator
MSAFSKEQLKEIEALINETGQRNGAHFERRAEDLVSAAIEAERDRLARPIEEFAPISDTEHDDVLVPKGEIVDWGKTLKALSDTIRTGDHE